MLALVVEDVAEAVVRNSVLRIESDRLTIFRNSLIALALVGQDDAEIVARKGVSRVASDGCVISLDGVVELSFGEKTTPSPLNAGA
jgi:hypothetical protein